jgi:hypothetical protein
VLVGWAAVGVAEGLAVVLGLADDGAADDGAADDGATDEGAADGAAWVGEGAAGDETDGRALDVVWVGRTPDAVSLVAHAESPPAAASETRVTSRRRLIGVGEAAMVQIVPGDEFAPA